MKVGIIGCGGIAPLHIKAYMNLKNVEVAGLCDLNQERAKSMAKRFHIKNTYANYRDMLEKESLNLVDICTPVSTHLRIISDVATTVPSILVEKPMALSVSECDAIIKIVKKHGSKLCIGHNQLFSPHIQKAKSLIESGKFKLACFETIQKESFEILRRTNLAPPWNVLPEQKGIIWEVCCHLAYLQLHFLQDVKEVYAIGSRIKYPVYDDFAVLLRTKNECFGIIELSWVSHETDTVYELRDNTGRRLQILWEFDYMLEKTVAPPFSFSQAANNFFFDEKRLLHKWLKFGISYLRKRKLFPTLNLIGSYVEAIKNDLPPPVTPEDGKKTIELLECIEKSLEEKRPISIF